jgi:hypothetical protein
MQNATGAIAISFGRLTKFSPELPISIGMVIYDKDVIGVFGESYRKAKALIYSWQEFSGGVNEFFTRTLNGEPISNLDCGAAP